MKEDGFFTIEQLMFDDDPELKKTATECMCNMVLNEEAFNKFKDFKVVVYVLLFSAWFLAITSPGNSRLFIKIVPMFSLKATVFEKNASNSFTAAWIGLELTKMMEILFL